MEITNIERNYNKHEDKYEIVMWVKDIVNYCTTPIVVKDTTNNSLNYAYASKLFKSWEDAGILTSQEDYS